MHYDYYCSKIQTFLSILHVKHFVKSTNFIARITRSIDIINNLEHFCHWKRGNNVAKMYFKYQCPNRMSLYEFIYFTDPSKNKLILNWLRNINCFFLNICLWQHNGSKCNRFTPCRTDSLQIPLVLYYKLL